VKIIIILALTLGIYMFFSGSGEVNRSVQLADNRLAQLKSDINKGYIRNALIIKRYADFLKRQKPDLSSLIDALAQDATTTGPMYSSLENRLFVATTKKSDFSSTKERVGELQAIAYAAQPSVYNAALTDVVNTLASMSDGRLPKVTGGSPNSVPGQKLVGNPTYGHWQTDNNGNSFWEWYGKYAMFNSVMNTVFGPRYYYDDWARSRPRSYYSDRGRSYFSSIRDLKKQDIYEDRRRNKFNRTGKSFTSTYKKFGGSGSSSFSRSSFSRSSFSRSSFRSGGHSFFSSSRSGFGGGK
jgi:hypothetical protein